MYLHNRVDGLGIREVVLHRVLWDLLGSAEDSLAEDKLAITSSKGSGVGGLVGHRGVLGHHHGGPLVPLPLGEHICDVLMTLDEVFLLWIDLRWSKENGTTHVNVLMIYSTSTWCYE